MEPILLKGKPVVEHILNKCLEHRSSLQAIPHLCILIVGNNPASDFYVENIVKQSKKFHVKVSVIKYDAIDTVEFLAKVADLSNDPTVNGIIIQEPLPKNLETGLIYEVLQPAKDVDGRHVLNLGYLLLDKYYSYCFTPCTAIAILDMIDFYNIETEGKHVVVVGRSNVVGKPISLLLLQKTYNATVTVCHSKTQDLSVFTKQADILITAVGKPNLINSSMIKEGVIIIDAGINEIKDNDSKIKYVGDVDFEDCKNHCFAITPTPGGVGTITTAALFRMMYCKVM
jgi:methylenetetrahydrofolate dehydrogenase (NADP+)/methenyltetrahydrofolate cyclohydrolase